MARSWRAGTMRAGTVVREGGEVVCRLHNGVTVEEHRHFWALVAGPELQWEEGTEVPSSEMMVPGNEMVVPGSEMMVPGSDMVVPGSEEGAVVGLKQGAVGTVVAGTMYTAVGDGRSRSAVTPGHGGLERHSVPMETLEGVKVSLLLVMPTLLSRCFARCAPAHSRVSAGRPLDRCS